MHCVPFRCGYDCDNMCMWHCGMNYWIHNEKRTLIHPSVAATNPESKADEISAKTLLCLHSHYLFMECPGDIKRFTLCTISLRSGFQFSPIFLHFEWSKHHIKYIFEISLNRLIDENDNNRIIKFFFLRVFRFNLVYRKTENGNGELNKWTIFELMWKTKWKITKTFKWIQFFKQNSSNKWVDTKYTKQTEWIARLRAHVQHWTIEQHWTSTTVN